MVHDDHGGHIADANFTRLEDHMDDVVPEPTMVASSSLCSLKKGLDFRIISGP